MQQSPELVDLVQRIYAALSNGDVSFFERHFSQQEGTLAIGTDPSEWWADYDTRMKVFRVQLEEMGNLTISTDGPQAYSEGSVGWAADRPSLHFADGTALPIRLSWVFHQEDTTWKIDQWHASTGMFNQDTLGKTLTTE